jgi:hypothetical protein
LEPPLSAQGIPDPAPPLTRWRSLGRYASMAECEAARTELVKEHEERIEFWLPTLGEDSPLLRVFVSQWLGAKGAKCVATDDSRS